MTGFNVYSTAQLVQIVPNLKVAQSFLLDSFFRRQVLSDTAEIAIDVDVGKRRMAPFVSPRVQGKLSEARRIETNLFRPAYIKDKRAPDLMRPVYRQIGESIGGGDYTPQERMDMNIVFELTDMVNGITRRLEWMAAQALMTGQAEVSGEGFPTQVVDFRRDAALTVTLSSGSKWGEANVSPTKDIDSWQRLVLQKSGAVCTDIVFTAKSWDAFLSDEKVKQTIWYAGGGGAGNAVQVGAQIQNGAVQKGVWGQYRLWEYNDWYVDENNVEQPMLPDGAMIMCGEELLGIRAFGAIIDPAFNYQSMPFCPKIWMENDPGGIQLMMQSAPLVIPSRVNASFAAIVC